MKKLLLTLTLLFSTTLFGQVQSHTANIVTHYVTIEDMVWSSMADEWVYVPKVARHRRSSNWSIQLSDNRTGLITMEDLKDGNNYYLEVYNWRAEDIKGKNGIVADFVQRVDGQKGTMILQWEDGKYGMSIFLPQEKTYLFFDNMNF
jgi:hypothetical protein